MIAPMEQVAGAQPMNEIEKLAKGYAEIRDQLGTLIGEMNSEIEAITKKKMPLIKKLIAAAAEKHDALKNAIEGSPALFDKPRTVIFHGVKVGFRKNEGKIEFDDAQTVVKRIEQFFANPDTYLRITKTPNKEALETLSITDLKRIGCKVSESGDEIVIKPVDSNVEKLVKSLLKSAIEDGEK